MKTWGAEKIADNRWRFRLWAPGLSGVSLVLDGTMQGMDKTVDGWFETEAEASAGTSYVFSLPDEFQVPDPAARAQSNTVHGPSKLVDPQAYEWETAWKGRPWHETVLYELHTGTFSAGSDFDGIRSHLDHLAEIGITAVELCPVAQFAGNRGWGYDGVLLYAPHPAYGGVDGLKRLVDAAHARGLMVFLDVVYNHFGPDGNYLHRYAPEFFDEKRHTPWGAAIAYDQRPVRQFVIDNALYWLHEYRLDGLRLDAIDQIIDPSPEPIVAELARMVRNHGFDRPVHLTTEDERNITWLHERDAERRPVLFDGEWNDDFHHVAHVLATGETEGYYIDYAQDAITDMATALGQGFVAQGRPSPYLNGKPRGQPSAHLPPSAFVNFIQNHDQIGNRAFGERLTMLAEPEAVVVLTALLLLSPPIPLVFMGEEWGETRPFQFFCDFHGELADAVRQGRRREFAHWPQFADPELRRRIPDPNAIETFQRSMLDWQTAQSEAGTKRLEIFRHLTAIRAEEIAPRIAGMPAMNGTAAPIGERGIVAEWVLADHSILSILANLGGEPFSATMNESRTLFREGRSSEDRWSIHVRLEEA